jgi:hypothetical protein
VCVCVLRVCACVCAEVRRGAVRRHVGVATVGVEVRGLTGGGCELWSCGAGCDLQALSLDVCVKGDLVRFFLRNRRVIIIFPPVWESVRLGPSFSERGRRHERTARLGVSALAP